MGAKIEIEMELKMESVVMDMRFYFWSASDVIHFFYEYFMRHSVVLTSEN